MKNLIKTEIVGLKEYTNRDSFIGLNQKSNIYFKCTLYGDNCPLHIYKPNTTSSLILEIAEA